MQVRVCPDPDNTSNYNDVSEDTIIKAGNRFEQYEESKLSFELGIDEDIGIPKTRENNSKSKGSNSSTSEHSHNLTQNNLLFVPSKHHQKRMLSQDSPMGSENRSLAVQ
jgi:hypothetical protein